MFNKVLIATDGSTHAHKAVEIGGDLAAKNGAEVVLVHVLLAGELDEDLRRLVEVEHLTDDIQHTPFPRQTEEAGHLGSLWPAEDRATSSAVLKGLGAEILKRAETVVRAHGVAKVSSRLLEGNVGSQILKTIKDERPDVVVCGGRGLSALEQLVLGSISTKIVQLCPVTCVTVR